MTCVIDLVNRALMTSHTDNRYFTSISISASPRSCSLHNLTDDTVSVYLRRVSHSNVFTRIESQVVELILYSNILSYLSYTLKLCVYLDKPRMLNNDRLQRSSEAGKWTARTVSGLHISGTVCKMDPRYTSHHNVFSSLSTSSKSLWTGDQPHTPYIPLHSFSPWKYLTPHWHVTSLSMKRWLKPRVGGCEPFASVTI